nr:type II secretion system protein [uncultured Sulfurimonas sp.]
MIFKKINIKNRFKKAFTMLELIFVIVIMGILAIFGVEFLAQAYNSFIFSKINNELQSNSATATEFIATRLQHRIKDSVIIRNTTAGYPGTISPIQGSIRDENATVVEWIGMDIDGFRGNSDSTIPHLPDWSGILDLNDSNQSVLTSFATNTLKVNSLIDALSDTNSSIADAAIYFIGSPITTINPWGYNGAILNQNETMHPIQSGGIANQFISSNATDFSGNFIYEYYKLAWTAYAVELRDFNNTSNSGNLWLHYNYQPWKGEVYNTDAQSSLIMNNVSSFQFRAAGSLIKIQVCVKSLLTNEEYSVCKEKTIY